MSYQTHQHGHYLKKQGKSEVLAQGYGEIRTLT
jgi:hypothetical protein